MAALSLTLLGAFQAALDGQPLTGFQSDKARALLAYLAVEAERPHSRGQLAALFWPEWPDQTARTYLRHALANLRQILHDQATTPPFFLVARDTLQMNVASNYQLDIANLRAVFMTPFTEQPVERLQQAIAQYHSPFLVGFYLHHCEAFEEWLLLTREQIQRRVIQGLHYLTDHFTSLGDYSQAQRYAQRCVELEPWQEEAHRQLMCLCALSGQRSAALAQYENCRRYLATELGVTPADETVALYEQICNYTFAGVREQPEVHVNGAQAEQPVKLSSFHNLPAQMTSFIGRTEECAALAALLRQPVVRLVTLTGPGGVGKTRLALQVASELRPDFADGVYFVALAPVREPSLALTPIAQTLGVRESSHRPLLESVKLHLQTKQLLLVVDNFEHLLPAADLLGELLRACPHLKCLATSRTLLHLYGEHEFGVLPLPVPASLSVVNDVIAAYPSVQLFCQRARAAKATFTLDDKNIQAVAAICVRLDGLPLAIELAAARVKFFSPQALWNRLIEREGQSSLHFLRNDVRDAPSRHQSLWLTIAWSDHLLNPAEQQIFRRLAIFTGGCTVQAAATVTHFSSDDQGQPASTAAMFALLVSLVDKNLIYQSEQVTPTATEPRFLLLETIREYGLAALQESGELAQVQQLHADYFLKIAEEADPQIRSADQDRWLDWLELEHDNLRAALTWLIDTKQPALALRLGSALSQFWVRRNYHHEGRQRLVQLANLPGDQPPSSALARILYYAAMLTGGEGAVAEAQAFYERSLHVARQVGDQFRMAYATVLLGEIAYNQGDYAKADALFEEGIALHRAVGDLSGLATILSHQGDKFARRGLFRNAHALATEGLALRRKLGDKWLMLPSICCLGNVCRLEGDYRMAQALFHEALQVSQALRKREAIAEAQFYLGLVALDQEQLDTAGDLLQGALQTMHEIELFWLHGDLLNAFAMLALAHHQLERTLCLAAAAAVFWSAREMKLPPVYQSRFDQMVRLARQPLAPTVAAAAWAKGEAMTVDEAVAYTFAIRVDARGQTHPATVQPIPRSHHVTGSVGPC